MDDRDIQKKELCHILGISRATVDRRRQDDPNFPRCHKADGNRKARCLWKLSDVNQYREGLLRND